MSGSAYLNWRIVTMYDAGIAADTLAGEGVCRRESSAYED